MNDFTGICKFCGQHRLVQLPEGATELEIEEEVLNVCNCIDAQAYRDAKEREARIEAAICSAQSTTYELFNEDYPEIENILNGCMKPLASGKIKKITISTGKKTKATISFAQETFKVEREDKSNTRRETQI